MADGTARPRLTTVVVLGALSTFGPLSLDLYLSALPELADDLMSTPSGGQLTITACLIGLAVGQLVAGPLSDRYGRRRPLLIGLVGYVLASLACAAAPSMEVLVLLRLIQGLTGSAGLVLSRAVARDLYSGRPLAVFFSRLTLISGLAPVFAPVLGGQLGRLMSWRGIFLVLAGIGLVLVLAGLAQEETLPGDRRTRGGFTSIVKDFRGLMRDRSFVGAALSSGLAGASMFAYIAGATFVLQRVYGLSAQTFSLTFGLNAVGIVALSQVGVWLGRRRSPLRLLGLGLGLNLVGAIGLTAAVLLDLGLIPVLVSLLVMVSPIGLVFPAATALALDDYPDKAGAASSLLGVNQYAFGAVVAPLVGVAGEQTAVPLSVVAIAASASATLVFITMVLPSARAGASGRRRLAAPPS